MTGFARGNHTKTDSKADPLIPEGVQDEAPTPLRNGNSETMAPRGLIDLEAKAPMTNEEEQLTSETTAMYTSNLPSSSAPDDDQPPSHPHHSAYWRSPHCLELVLCVSFYVATTVFTAAQPFPTNERSIPYQYLENTGDYVLNQEYNQEKTGSTVSPTVVCIAALVLQLGLGLARRLVGLSSSYDMHATACAYLVAMSLNRLATEWVKNYVGYLRPIFYEKCVPDENYEYCTDNDGGGRKSFPSGHASISFTGCMLLMLYIHGRLGMGYHKARLERRRWQALAASEAWHDDTSYWVSARSKLVSMVALLPLALAGMISADRVRTNHHFPADVVGGAVLGSSIAAFIHFLWF